MPDASPNPELLHSLGRLVRGLSALFWGLPMALIVCVWIARFGLYSMFGVVPPMATTGLLVFGLWQMDAFQKQERPWLNALDRAKLLALVNFGLSPFVFMWNHQPGQELFAASVAALTLSAWYFILALNSVLLRLGEMLPDETLRQDTRQFTSLNRVLLWLVLLLVMFHAVLARIPQFPQQLGPLLNLWDRLGGGLILILVLLPLAMTMALIWKTKEVILESVFGR